MTTNNEQKDNDPRIEALAKLFGSSAYENLSVQVSGKIKTIKDDYIRIKNGTGSIRAVIGDREYIFVAEVQIDKDGNKSSKELSLSDVKEGDKVKASLNLTFSGDWQLISLSIRN
jgi:hypothetical protein